jgi:SAM-dependent methyltransferase
VPISRGCQAAGVGAPFHRQIPMNPLVTTPPARHAVVGAPAALPAAPTWLPSSRQLRDFYGKTSAYPYYRLQVTDNIARLLPPVEAPVMLTVLDVGSGDGYLGAVLQTFRPHTRVTGVETHRRALTRPGFEPILYDGLHLPFDDASFDAAIVSNVLHHADDQEAVLREVCRVTRRRVIIKDHLARHFLDRWKLALLDQAGNRRFGADTRGTYLDRRQWEAMFSSLPGATVTWYEGLSFRTGILEMLFSDDLEVMFTIDLSPTRGA